MGNKQKNFNDKYEDYMQNFLCRLLRHDLVVSYVNDFFNKTEQTYYSFFMLMKVLGAHTNLRFQTNYWSDCYIYFYEKLGVHGILFIPLLLCKGSTDDKKEIIKKYLNEHINSTREKTRVNSNLVLNLIEFKKVILTYVSCISTRALENVIKAMDNDPKESTFLKDPERKKEIKLYRVLYSNHLVESFVEVLLRPYSRQNYYVNAGKFIDDNIDFLTNDKKIRLRLREFSLKQKEISDLLKRTSPLDPYSNIRGQNLRNKNNIQGETNILYNNNNIPNYNYNINQNINRPYINYNQMPNVNKNGFPLNTKSHHLNEIINTNERGMRNYIEFPKNNVIKEKLKGGDNIQNNLINLSFKSGEWDMGNENSVRQIDIKSNNSNNIVNNFPKNITSSDFEESFREENFPKKI